MLLSSMRYSVEKRMITVWAAAWTWSLKGFLSSQFPHGCLTAFTFLCPSGTFRTTIFRQQCCLVCPGFKLDFYFECHLDWIVFFFFLRQEVSKLKAIMKRQTNGRLQASRCTYWCICIRLRMLQLLQHPVILRICLAETIKMIIGEILILRYLLRQFKITIYGKHSVRYLH